VGVHGTTGSATGVGVLAEETGGGNALQVNGPALFSRSGSVVIPSGTKAVDVAVSGLTAASLVIATVQNKGAVWVASAVPDVAGGKFTINLNKAPKSPATATVAWFVVN
jgi:hypothetical protein